MLKLYLAQRIPLSQFCSINHGFLFKHRKLCLESPSILSCQSNLVWGGNVFERFKNWKCTLEDSALLCRVRSIWTPSPEEGGRLGRAWERQRHQAPPTLCPGGEIADPPWSPNPFSWRDFCTSPLRQSFSSYPLFFLYPNPSWHPATCPGVPPPLPSFHPCGQPAGWFCMILGWRTVLFSPLVF